MPFVMSEGSLEQVSRSYTPTIPTSHSVRLSESYSSDYAGIWRSQPQVRTVVSFLARNIAQLGIHLYRRVSDTDRERVTDHPLAQLMSRPNPFTTRYRLIESLVSDLAIYDNAFLAKVYGSEKPSVLRLDPRHVTPVSYNPFAVETYRYSLPTSPGHHDFPADQVIHFRGYNAEDARWGSSPMETLRTILAEDHQASAYREQLWRNGARIMGYLQRPVDAPQWSQETRERFRRSWQAQYTGNGGNAGGTPILEDGMTFQSAAVTPTDAQYIESRKLTREEVAAAFHIPLPMVGILEHATYSNITEQHKQLYQDTLGPWLAMLCEEFALQLIPDFESTSDLYLEFNMAEKLRGSFEEQAGQLQASVGGPYMTRNEARARLNLPQIDSGDELIVPLNVLTETTGPKQTRQQAAKLLEGLGTQ